jgi:hypothetical protein
MTPRQQNEQLEEVIPKICPLEAGSAASDQSVVIVVGVMLMETLFA